MSKLQPIIHKIKNILFIYLLWILFSLPVITIGAATTAAYYVAFKIISGKSNSVFKEFIQGFKTNLFQGTIALISIVAAYFGGYKLVQYLITGDPDLIVKIIAGFILLLAYMYTLYIMPIIARYTNKIHLNFESSLLLCTHHPLMALCLTLVLIGGIFLYFANKSLIIPLILAGYPVYFWAKAFIALHIFKKQEELIAKEKAAQKAQEEQKSADTYAEEESSEISIEEEKSDETEETDEDNFISIWDRADLDDD